VLLTLIVYWYSAILWQAYNRGEARTKIAGGIIILLSAVVAAHQAFTRDDYRITKWT
jgi:hypothetical protein